MNKLQVPKIIRPLRLTDYAPEFDPGAVIQVWVNPPTGTLQDYYQLLFELNDAREAVQSEDSGQIKQAIADMGELSDKLVAAIAEFWSQHEDPETHWAPAEVRELVEQVGDTEPGLWPWLTRRTLEMIEEHRGARKKG